ncbi:hypothetical protein CO661_31920 [Sinorhizobium fredii]|uniref:Uncharacterized protein n=1 Tax=Rhizobium fredii TaxID=380 RepID=A0A2A6LP21_RHIFR|nr:DndE family protein [Sinorhizobium fredii]PDT43972.1 hypothetical protein CO661_31920 [Sinorhizobium fredii]
MGNPALHLADLSRMDFRTSAVADQKNTELQRSLQLDYRYQPARIAIGLSLSNPQQPHAPADVLGKPIRGETLFGLEDVDLALWLTLLSHHSGIGSPSRKQVADLVASHWARGIGMLAKDFLGNEAHPQDFLTGYATRQL